MNQNGALPYLFSLFLVAYPLCTIYSANLCNAMPYRDKSQKDQELKKKRKEKYTARQMFPLLISAGYPYGTKLTSVSCTGPYY